MPEVVAIRLRYNPKQLWFDHNGLEIHEGDHVVVATERGSEIGLATGDVFTVTDEQVAELPSALKPVVRVATDADLARIDELAAKDDAAMPVFRELIESHGLDMKPVCVEYLFEGDKAVFYFSSEDRVDFRELVRELAGRLHVRVDMRQIGVRDEARLVGGYAHCGQELCCSRMGGEFEPVSIRMAKEQDLPLNPLKISGVCGRLMCCLRYEFDAYKDFKSRAPKHNALIETPLGLAKVIDFDTPREIVNLRLEDGKQLSIPLSVMETDESVEGGRPCKVSMEALESCACPAIELDLAAVERELSDGEVAVNTPSDRRPRRRIRAGETAARKDGQEGARNASSDEKGDEQEQDTQRGRRRRRGGDAGPKRENAQGTDASKSEAEPRGEKQQGRRRRRGEKQAGQGAADATRQQGAAKQGEKGAQKQGAQKQQPRQPSKRQGQQPISDGGAHEVRQRPGQNSSGIRAGRGDAASKPRTSEQAIPDRRPRRRHPGSATAADAPKDAGGNGPASGGASGSSKPAGEASDRG